MKAGESITFGSYPQSGSTGAVKEPVKWKVLSVDKAQGTALCLSEKILGFQRYHETYEAITWEKSDIRAWLKDDFINAAFTSDQQKSIVAATIKNEPNPSSKVEAGNDTTDKVFLLSIVHSGRKEQYLVASLPGFKRKKGGLYLYLRAMAATTVRMST